jgi:hypothetical protein
MLIACNTETQEAVMIGISRRRMLGLALLSPIANLASAPSNSAASQTGARALSSGPLFFVKGVYQQPAEKMALWKARGINTIFTMNQGADYGQWTDEAIRQGLYMVREPAGIDNSGSHPSLLIVDQAAFDRDVGNPSLLAFALMDEPSNLRPDGKDITYDDVFFQPSEVDIVARDWATGGKALWINHIGNHINNAYLGRIMSDYADSPYIDWLSHDCYPVAAGDALILELDDYVSTPQGHAIDRLSRWSGGKPQFSFVGLTQYNGSVGRATTAPEFRAQAWSSIIHGAVGIIYFTFTFSPEFSYDATPQELLDELQMFHAQLDEIEDILVDAGKGGRRPSQLLRSAHEPPALSEPALPYPFEACAIRIDHGEYKIVLNLSNEPADLTYPPWGLSSLRFDPYQCRRGYTAAELARA